MFFTTVHQWFTVGKYQHHGEWNLFYYHLQNYNKSLLLPLYITLIALNFASFIHPFKWQSLLISVWFLPFMMA